MNYGKEGVRERQKALNSKSAKWGRKLALTLVKVFLIVCVAFGVVIAAAGIGMFKGIIASTPQIEIAALVPSGQASIVYDSQGNEIDRFVGSNANRTIVTMDQVPEYLGKAFVAIEDERFYTHNGIDVKGLFRAGYQFLKTKGSETQGASTITQQLLKNAIFTDWTSEGDNMIKKIKRKFQEQYLAIEVTKNTQKEQVLLAYMNTINCGQNTLGVEAAALRYFGKSCSELTLSECAVIACITNNPSGYNPIRFPEANAERRDTCLNKMLELGFITREEYNEAMADTEAVYERIQLHDDAYLASNSYKGTYFSDALQKQIQADLVNKLGYTESMATNLIMSGGLKVFTTQDSKIQQILDEEFSNPDNYPDKVSWLLDYAMTVTLEDKTKRNFSKENMVTWFKKYVDPDFDLLFDSQEEALEAIAQFEKAAAPNAEPDDFERRVSFTAQPQASMTIIDQSTGYVLAIVGGRGTKEGRLTLNRATDTVRQPGSTFKIVSTYAPAIDSAGLNLATVLNDTAFSYQDGKGKPVTNSNDKFDNRPISIREAIIRSKNTIAVKTLTQITPQLGYDYLLNFGFSTIVEGKMVNGKWFTDIMQPMALGGITDGVKNVELCAAYAAIANEGAYIEPKFYSKVLDSNGKVLLDNTSPRSTQVIKPTTAALLTDAMVDVVTHPSGTGTSVNFGNMAIAGKTGTTSDYKDVWFAGYTPYYTAATWVGYDNNEVLDKNNGERSLARKLWRAVMSRIHEDLPNEQFTTPEGIITVTVCSESGKLPIPGLCDGHLKTEYFADGTEPYTSCDLHYSGMVCAYDGLAASTSCPFQVPGTCTLPLIEDESLHAGSAILLPDGTVIQPKTSNYCQHTAEFFLNPDYEALLRQQEYELYGY